MKGKRDWGSVPWSNDYCHYMTELQGTGNRVKSLYLFLYGSGCLIRILQSLKQHILCQNMNNLKATLYFFHSPNQSCSDIFSHDPVNLAGLTFSMVVATTRLLISGSGSKTTSSGLIPVGSPNWLELVGGGKRVNSVRFSTCVTGGWLLDSGNW